jgi:hypothetical protein
MNMVNDQLLETANEPIHRREALRLGNDPIFRAVKLAKYEFKNRLHKEPRQEFSFVQFYKYKCIFVHIPKTAGISVAATLFKNRGGGHETIQYYQSILKPEDFDRFFKFTFVRNPWARLYSAYHYLKAGGFGPNDKRWFEENLSQFKDFEEFVLHWLTPDNIQTKPHFRPQTDFILDSDGVNRMDYVGRMENLCDDFEKITNKLSIKRKLSFMNRGQNSDYSKAYTKEMIRLVEEIYKTDIVQLNYTCQL